MKKLLLLAVIAVTISCSSKKKHMEKAIEVTKVDSIYIKELVVSASEVIKREITQIDIDYTPSDVPFEYSDGNTTIRISGKASVKVKKDVLDSDIKIDSTAIDTAKVILDKKIESKTVEKDKNSNNTTAIIILILIFLIAMLLIFKYLKNKLKIN